MSPTTLRILTWNMNQTESSWTYLEALAYRHGVDIALLQEARLPADPPAAVCEPGFDEPDRWQVPVPVGRRRHYCSAVLCFNSHLDFTPLRPTALADTPCGGLAASHPGQFAVARVAVPGQGAVTVVSLYGLWDTMADSGDIYPYASLHRALSDLMPVYQARGARVVLAGDLNIWHGYGDSPWRERNHVVFDRLASQGLELLGPFRTDGPTLDGCPCGPSPECRHVLTFRYQRNPRNRPYQNDYVFADRSLSRGAVVTAVSDDEVWLHSDHVPVIAEFRIDEECAA